MAKYQQYAEYKDSGYFHLGEIPKDWKILKLKHLTRCLDGQRIPLNAIERGEKKGNIPYWGANKIVDYVDDWIFYEQLILLGEDGAPFFDPNKDVAFLVNGKIWPNNHVHVLRPFKKLVNPTFLTYAINCTDFSLYISGSTRDKLNQSDMDNICIRYCSQAEQTQIANFLDHETAKIDSLIEKQQQLIQLLKEKRQAVISHAVTKGLNPNISMKDSGVEWLGEVPEHWVVCAIKYIVSIPITDGPHETPIFIDEGIPFISAEAVSKGYINFDKKRACISERDHQRFSLKYIPKRHDIFMVKSGATTGVTAIVETDDVFNIWSPLAVIRCNKYSYPYFVLNFFRSKQFNEALETNWTFGTQQNIGMGILGNIRITQPPILEAIKIIEYLDQINKKYELLISKVEIQIDILQERRTALISAAVTGKIDVRNWQNPTEAKMEFSA